MIEIVLALLSAIFGVSSSVIYELISTILNKKTTNAENNMTERIKKVSTVLENSIRELSGLQNELEERVQMVGRLKEEAEQAESIISLTEDQVKAIRTTLKDELQKEGRKSFWQGVTVNFIFFVLGALVSYIVSKYLI